MVHIIYGNGEIFSGNWLDAPRNRDVQVVIYDDPDTGWTLRHGARGRSQCDFFRMAQGGVVVGMDLSGFIDHAIYELELAEPCTDLPTLIHKVVHESGGLIKQGKMLTTREWDTVYKQAIEFRRKLLENGPT